MEALTPLIKRQENKKREDNSGRGHKLERKLMCLTSRT